MTDRPSTPTPDRDTLVREARRSFADRFGREATVVAVAPGRVNLIGDHTDYNDGFALPMAIDRYVVIAADPVANGEMSTLHSGAMGESRSFDRIRSLEAGGSWLRYVAGVIALAERAGRRTPAFDGWIESSLPAGAGLASSAALEVAVATLVETLTGRPFAPLEKAKLCQQAEHEYARVPCGLMDQIAVTSAIGGHAVLLDCRSLATTPVRLPTSDVAVLIADSGGRRELAAGIYAERRRACHEAARHLDVAALRDASLSELTRAASDMPDETFRRARHVITENARVLACADALAAGQWPEAGRLMHESHDSLRDDFEVSMPALDALVETFRAIGEPGGVYGSRLTGAGLGGCVIALVRAGAAESVVAAIRASIDDRRREHSVFTTAAVHGSHSR